MAKAYDAKKSYWVPDGTGGFVEGILESETGGKASVSIGHDKKVFKRDQIQQVEDSVFYCLNTDISLTGQPSQDGEVR